jgi:heme exporter protein C
MRDKIMLVLGGICAVILSLNLYKILLVLPNEKDQGAIYRIMYFHVPSIFTGFTGFFVALAASGMYLATRNLKYDAFAAAVTEVSLAFSTIVLVTGMIWGRIIWGIWWTWDARLTTTLVLWLIYVSYLLLRRFAAGPQVQTLAAVLGIFGALDVPIVYMSNRWWRTQHPAPVFGGDEGSGMKDPQMLAAFGWGMASWLAWGLLILYFRYRVERKHQLNAQQEALEALEAKI